MELNGDQIIHAKGRHELEISQIGIRTTNPGKAHPRVTRLQRLIEATHYAAKVDDTQIVQQADFPCLT